MLVITAKSQRRITIEYEVYLLLTIFKRNSGKIIQTASSYLKWTVGQSHCFKFSAYVKQLCSPICVTCVCVCIIISISP